MMATAATTGCELTLSSQVSLISLVATRAGAQRLDYTETGGIKIAW